MCTVTTCLQILKSWLPGRRPTPLTLPPAPLLLLRPTLFSYLISWPTFFFPRLELFVTICNPQVLYAHPGDLPLFRTHMFSVVLVYSAFSFSPGIGYDGTSFLWDRPRFSALPRFDLLGGSPKRTFPPVEFCFSHLWTMLTFGLPAHY